MFESRMTWEKLKLELDLLNTESPTSLMPLVIGANSYLMPDEPFDKLYQQLSYMNYEIASQCESLCEEERLLILNDFFFSQKGFTPNVSQVSNQEPQNLLINYFLQLRQGHPILISIAYSHFAAQLDLPIYICSTKMPHILKWIRGKEKTTFIDTMANGQPLTYEDIIEIYNTETESNSISQNAFDILPARNVLSHYLNELYSQYNSELCSFSPIEILNILIGLHPSHLKYLSARALVYKDEGDHKAALKDLKRYFSFIDRTSASPQLKMAYYELQAICSTTEHNISTVH